MLISKVTVKTSRFGYKKNRIFDPADNNCLNVNVNLICGYKLTPSELEEVSGATGWCVVCKGWEE